MELAEWRQAVNLYIADNLNRSDALCAGAGLGSVVCALGL